MSITYNLPEDRIALYPVQPRDSCRLMVVELPSFKVEHKRFTDISQYFMPDDVIVINNSRVLNARLKGRKETGGKVEFLLLEEKDGLWVALGKPAHRLREDMDIKIISPDNRKCRVKIIEKQAKGSFFISTPDNILEYGYVPLPPYIVSRRDVCESDSSTYQTKFAVKDGSVASPTAALHFTDNVIEDLMKKGVKFASVTLHVGPGTFRVNYEIPDAERYEISRQSTRILNNAKRICVCGTTVMRTVENIFDGNRYVPSSGQTSLFITPGYKFSNINMFLTNFHLPGTPLLQMVAAFIEQHCHGEGVKKIVELYTLAVDKGYRFLSYGDAMLLMLRS